MAECVDPGQFPRPELLACLEGDQRCQQVPVDRIKDAISQAVLSLEGRAVCKVVQAVVDQDNICMRQIPLQHLEVCQHPPRCGPTPCQVLDLSVDAGLPQEVPQPLRPRPVGLVADSHGPAQDRHGEAPTAEQPLQRAAETEPRAAVAVGRGGAREALARQGALEAGPEGTEAVLEVPRSLRDLAGRAPGLGRGLQPGAQLWPRPLQAAAHLHDLRYIWQRVARQFRFRAVWRRRVQSKGFPACEKQRQWQRRGTPKSTAHHLVWSSEIAGITSRRRRQVARASS
eukprot:CAMPEP_0168396316 /NCGR_PEP_ID=MMETSP0228-20121227/20488_1 /TAXON_ID=133427 /ORGANISM="Protoceratium reticulatum, Strain CCCM 535 (=CCMP 1889)" /LENGTH=284 /DNA_ID=CAMNT_0008409759 /DNA_START=917 /DNA_END=1769 /DNA_ORIENTATION=+